RSAGAEDPGRRGQARRSRCGGRRRSNAADEIHGEWTCRSGARGSEEAITKAFSTQPAAFSPEHFRGGSDQLPPFCLQSIVARATCNFNSRRRRLYFFAPKMFKLSADC